jgi:hypothetical protein
VTRRSLHPRPVTTPCFTLLLGFLPAVLAAQVTFERTFGGAADDFGHTVVVAGTGYVLSGYTYSFGSGAADAYLVRTDSLGETLWTRVYGSDADDWSFHAVTTVDSGCVVVGYSTISGGRDVSMLKTGANGDSSWARTYGGGSDDIGYAVAQCPDSGFIVVGTTFSFGAGQCDVYVVRTNAAGDTLWTRTYGGASEEQGNAVVPTTDSGFIICAWTRSFGAGAGDVYLIKTDARGETLWTRRHGGAGNDFCHAIRQTPDRGYIMTGATFSYGAVQGDFYLIRTDACGDTLWTQRYGTAASDLGHVVDLAADGGFVVTGVTRSFGAGGYDAWLVRTDSNGDTLSTRTFGGDQEERAFSVVATADGGFAVGGWTGSSGAGGTDAWLVKTDSTGRGAVAGPESPPTRTIAGARFARGVLSLRTEDGRQSAELLDASGRPVMSLHAGPNDVRHLSSGVYFVLEAADGRQSEKVVIRR